MAEQRKEVTAWQAVVAAKTILLTTYRRDGTPVATPIWHIPDGDRLLVRTGRETGKFRRIRNNGSAQVAPSTMRGKPTGDPAAATCRILPESEGPRIIRELGRRYGVQEYLTRWYHRVRGFHRHYVFLEILPGIRPLRS